jgi:hypothetical protein
MKALAILWFAAVAFAPCRVSAEADSIDPEWFFTCVDKGKMLGGRWGDFYLDSVDSGGDLSARPIERRNEGNDSGVIRGTRCKVSSAGNPNLRCSWGLGEYIRIDLDGWRVETEIGKRKVFRVWGWHERGWFGRASRLVCVTAQDVVGVADLEEIPIEMR